jgi:hypothetical protein
MKEFVRRSTSVSFRRLFADMRRELKRRLSVVLQRTLGSYLCDALHEDIIDLKAQSLSPGVKLVGCFYYHFSLASQSSINAIGISDVTNYRLFFFPR